MEFTYHEDDDTVTLTLPGHVMGLIGQPLAKAVIESLVNHEDNDMDIDSPDHTQCAKAVEIATMVVALLQDAHYTREGFVLAQEVSEYLS